MKSFIIHSYNKKKNLLLVFLCLLLLFISYNIFKLDYNDNDIFFTRNQNDLFVNGIMSGNNLAVYNIQNNTYYFSKSLFNSKNITVFSPYDSEYILNRINNDTYEILIFCDKYYQKRYIKILDVPIVSIKFDYAVSSNHRLVNMDDYLYDDDSNLYANILFELMDNNMMNRSLSSTLYQTGRFKVRGATSSIFPKKSYKVEFEDKISLLGMQKDDDWVLDSLYSDKSKIRNKFSSDLWNMINNNQAIANDLTGQFVELFVNDEYKGLYVLKEKVDRKMTGVSEYGLLVKSINHVSDDIKNNFIINNVNMNENNNDVFLENFELKNYTSNSLNSFILKLSNYYSNLNYSSISQNFNIDNFLNYKVFVMLISGEDNLTKNQYLSLQDSNSKILITPWDMDLTWGLNWSYDDELNSIFSMDSSIDASWIDENITKNMDSKTLSLMKTRYWELRKNVITMDTINGYLDSYKELLVNSGAAQRDSERWYEYDVEFEIEQIREWARRRIEFLDEYFK